MEEKKELGNKPGFSDSLVYLGPFAFRGSEILINIAVTLLTIPVMYFIASKYKDKITIVLLTAVVTLTGMSVVNVNTVNKSIDALESYMEKLQVMPSYNLSKEGENVLVIMLDRAMGEYIPYIMNEAPDIKEKFDGFTYYNNVISFGGHTNFAAPALLGGYEYTPVELNKRDEEPLVDKHNESLLALPVLFAENDYDVAILDPPYANYQWIPDLSLYDEYEGVRELF